MIREILPHRDPRLREVARPVPEITEEVLALCSDLVQTMCHGAREAIGLAATQIGEPLRIFVMQELKRGERPRRYIFVNPELVSSAGSVAMKEGCLSFPDGSYVLVPRAATVKLEWTARDGRRNKRRFDGLSAICIQHELDHLEGKLMSDFGEVLTRGAR